MAVNIKIMTFCDMVSYFGGQVQTSWGTHCIHLQVDCPEDSNLHIQWKFENWDQQVEVCLQCDGCHTEYACKHILGLL
jgi:hypothetical protein